MAGSSAPQGAAAPSPLRLPLILIALSLPLLAGAWYARFAADSITGPLAIAASSSEVAVSAPGLLYRLDARGALQSVDGETIAEDAVDSGLAFVGESLIASPGIDDVLLRCSADACEPFSDDNWAPTGAVQTWFDGVRFWFSETGADRIQRYDTAGKRIDMPVSDLSAPGSLWVQDDMLYVADAGERKILSYRIHKRGIGEGETFATWRGGPDENPIDRPQRLLSDGDGGFTAIFSDARRRNGALLAIDANGTATPFDTDSFVNPVGLTRLGDALLVLDEGLMQVLRVDADGSVSVFGDEDFQTQLADQQGLRAGLRATMPVLFALGILALAIGGSWLLNIVTYRAVDPALAVKPDAEGILWLPAECDLAPKRIPRFVLVAAPLALIPAAAVAATTPWPLVAVAWAMLPLSVAALVPMVAASRASLPKGERVGIRDRQLIITHPEKGRREYPLPRVEWSEHLLRPEPGLDIPLLRNGVHLYHASTIEELLLPRLNLMRKIDG